MNFGVGTSQFLPGRNSTEEWVDVDPGKRQRKWQKGRELEVDQEVKAQR